MLAEVHAAAGFAAVTANDLQTALDDPKVRSILLNVDSPGGEANGISDDGRVIVGNAQYPGSATLQPVGFRLVLPAARSIATSAFVSSSGPPPSFSMST